MSTVIKIENLYKEYRLGVVGYGTLYRDLQSWWAKIRGEQDPNSTLSASYTNSNQSNKDRILAIKDLNLEVKNGEVLGIIGANGAGKSTLLKILSRVTAPTSGTIKYKGRICSLLEVGTGFHGELTGRENIYLNGAINGLNKREIKKRLDEIVDFAGVGQFLDTPVKRYSSGMHVRLGFAVAAHLDPDIMVVDEVLAVGDASFQKKAIGKMKDIVEGEGRTVLFVSHNMESIKHLCSRAILIDKGQIIQDGQTNDVVDNYLKDEDQKTTKSKIIFERHESKIFQLIEIGLMDHNDNLTTKLDRIKPFKIYAKYIFLEQADHVDIKIAINTASNQPGVNNNTLVMQWSDRHMNLYKYGNEKMKKSAGEYLAIFEFPEYVLNSGKYKLEVFLNSPFGPVDHDYNSYINFYLYDDGSSHNLQIGRSAGLLGMPIKLNIKQLDK